MEESERKPPAYGCATGLGKTVFWKITGCAMSTKEKALMTLIAEDALGNAGWEAEEGEEGIWCNETPALWIKRLQEINQGCSRQYLWKMLRRLAELRLITIHPIPQGPAEDPWKYLRQYDAHCQVLNRIRINPIYAEWVALDDDYRRKRSTRAGAGNPTWKQASVTHLKASVAAAGGEPAPLSNVLRSVDEGLSNVLRPVAGEPIKRVTLASYEPGHTGTRAELQEEYGEEKETEESPTGERAAPKENLWGATLPPKAPYWPEKQAGEAENLAYYLRVFKEADPKKYAAMLTRLAHEKLGSDPTAFGRIGKLAKEHGGAGIVVRAILRTAAEITIGDNPLDYLTRLVTSQQNGKGGTRGREPTRQQQEGERIRQNGLGSTHQNPSRSHWERDPDGGVIAHVGTDGESDW